MGLTSSVTRRLEVPHESGQWVEIRKLPWRKLREAAEAQRAQAYLTVRALGKDGIDAIAQVTPAQITAFRQSASAPYDAGTLLRAAVVAWSYSDKPTPDQIDDLDTETATWLLEAVVALALPGPDEAAAKNA